MNWGAGADMISNRSKWLTSVPNVSTTVKCGDNMFETKFHLRGESI